MKTQDTYKVHHSFTFSEGGVSEEQVEKYFVHLERLEGIEITRFHFVPMTDELSVCFNFHDYEFKVWMDWGGDLVLQTTEDAPIEIFEVLKQQLSNLEPVSSEELEEAKKRYTKIAKMANKSPKWKSKLATWLKR